MPDYFDQIASLVKDADPPCTVAPDRVTFKVVVTPRGCRASFKRPGRRAEVVQDYYWHDAHVNANEVLRELLHRLGVFHGLPTLDELIKCMTPSQRARMERLIAEHQQLKREIVAEHQRLKHPERVEDVEPVLASPRSSLNPAFLEGEDDDRG